MFDLNGKVGLVTGGTSGIGLGLAGGLAEAGADVVVWGRNPDKNRAAVELLEGRGGAGRVLAQRCDVGDEDAVEAAMVELVAELGGCTVASATPASARSDAPSSRRRWPTSARYCGSTWREPGSPPRRPRAR